jgi:hypothetical protein
VKKRDRGPGSAINRMRAGLASMMAWALCASLIGAVEQQAPASNPPIYKQRQAPVEARIDDLVGRMTLAEKVRQLDLYSGAARL